MADLSPIVLIVFNRPEQTLRLIQALERVRPDRLLVVGDGARDHRPGEHAAVLRVRKLFERLPWKCDVKVHWADRNLGCRARVSSGIDWAFSQVQEAIVLEDDCIPEPSFFRFCGELLDRYRHDERIFSISGTNYLSLPCPSTEPSYYFSRYSHCWGWATWKRAWRHYQASLEFAHSPQFGAFLRQVLGSRRAAWYWRYIFRAVERGHRDSWAYRWTLSCWRQNGLSVCPRQSMVENAGLQGTGTHTQKSVYRMQPTAAMDFPLVHPDDVFAHTEYDGRVEDTHFSRSARERLSWCCRKLLMEVRSRTARAGASHSAQTTVADLYLAAQPSESMPGDYACGLSSVPIAEQLAVQGARQ